MYPKMLRFTPKLSAKINMSGSNRDNICPLIVTKGADQVL
jgi:hypothetical protein